MAEEGGHGPLVDDFLYPQCYGLARSSGVEVPAIGSRSIAQPGPPVTSSSSSSAAGSNGRGEGSAAVGDTDTDVHNAEEMNDSSGDEEEESKDGEDRQSDSASADSNDAASSMSEGRKGKALGKRRGGAANRLRYACASGTNDSENGDEDDSGPEAGTPRKTIQVGADFQAKIPPLQDGAYSGDGKPWCGEGKLLWSPQVLDEGEVFVYLKKIKGMVEHAARKRIEDLLLDGLSASNWDAVMAATIDALPRGSHVADDEQALFTLMQCNFDVEEALRQKGGQATPRTSAGSGVPSNWSEEECQNFETGLRIYGKRFYEIQQHKVSSRSVGELVQFYYLWKKTERHDVFSAKARLEKKKYSMHPGTTDYIDRYLDEPDSQSTMDAVHASFASGTAVGQPAAAVGAAGIGLLQAISSLRLPASAGPAGPRGSAASGGTKPPATF